jgi:hypothetical protein
MEPHCWFADAAVPVRGEVAEAHAEWWRRLAKPGTWWTGAERVAIAAEVRAARSCALCRARREALSPMSVTGDHDIAPGAETTIPAAAIDAVHRIVTDANRLSSGFVAKLDEEGINDAHYVELVGIVVSLISIDEVMRGVGASAAPLPEPEPGEPARKRPAEAAMDGAWVPLMPASLPKGENQDLWPMPKAPYVLRAMSLVPDAVRDLELLSAAHYLPLAKLMDFSQSAELSRPQIELVAGRVSALNECFY